MTAYNWRCQVCDSVNDSSADICATCKSPANLSALDIEARKATYVANGGKQFVCSKCGHDSFTSGEIRVSGSVLGSLLEVEGNRFTYVACKQCRFTEFYLGDKELMTSILDFLT
jgi:predicted nucleic-acid-binding Zn-ribbon protein